MKLRYLKSIIPAMSLALMLGMTSCANELNISPIDPSVDLEFSQDEVFAKLYGTLGLTGQKEVDAPDIESTDEGTTGFYRLVFTANEYPSDEVISSWVDGGITDWNFMTWDSSHGQIEMLYGRLNYDITLCNLFLDQTAGLTDEKTVRQRAEARFLRALHYYYLMDLFGNVPFSETVSTELPVQIKRADLFKYLETELKEIESAMYEPRQAPFGRADKVATWFLLSRMYLNAEVYTGTARWNDAITYSKKVLESGYELCSNYSHLFMADNDKNVDAMNEIILPIRQDGRYIRSYGGSLFVIASMHTSGMTPWGTSEGWGGVRARHSLIQKFFSNSNPPMNGVETDMVAAAGDDRALFYAGDDRTLEITTPGVFKEGLSISKWSNVRSDGAPASDPKWADTDVPFFRLGEVYLNYAEALVRNGDTSSEALDAINELRVRANTSRLAAINLDIILDERSREMYAEGIRRTDLVRYGYFTSNSYLWDWKGGQPTGTSVSSAYNLLPIPASDLNANRNLVQNPGY